MNGEILPGTQTRWEQKKKGRDPPLLPRKRESPKSTSNKYLSLFSPLRSPANCLGVKKAEEATEEEAEDQEIVGKRAIRFHYPSHRSSNFDAARNAQIYINLSAVVSLAALSCEARRKAKTEGEKNSGVEGGGEDGCTGLLISFYQPP